MGIKCLKVSLKRKLQTSRSLWDSFSCLERVAEDRSDLSAGLDHHCRSLLARNTLLQEWLVQLVILSSLPWKKELFGRRKKRTFFPLSLFSESHQVPAGINSLWHLMQK